jgi:hypothetical protein
LAVSPDHAADGSYLEAIGETDVTSQAEAQLLSDVAEIKTILTRREACQQACERTTRWAFGNGVQGADEILAELKRESDAAKEDAKRWRYKWRDVQPAIVSGAVVGIVLLLAQVLLASWSN